GLGGILLGVESGADIWSYGGLPMALPEGAYRLVDVAPEAATAAALGWALGGYVFDRYKKPKRPPPPLVWPGNADRAAVHRAAAFPGGRPGHPAGRGPGPGRARGRRPPRRQGAWRALQRDRRRRAARHRLSDDPRRRAGQQPGAAADRPALGSPRATHHPGR